MVKIIIISHSPLCDRFKKKYNRYCIMYFLFSLMAHISLREMYYSKGILIDFDKIFIFMYTYINVP